MSDADIVKLIHAIGRGELPPAGQQRALARQRIVNHLLSQPIDEALFLAASAPNWQSPVEDLDYLMEDGLLVFTAWYHLRRGYCCGNGCRHCPYPAA